MSAHHDVAVLTARLFAPLRVEIDGRPLPEIGVRPRSVLAWLLLNPDQHARAHVAARFWPDVLETSARASLRTALSAIRTALEAVGGGAYLEADRTTVRISAELPHHVDVHEFDRLAASSEPADLEAALALARAPLLPGLADDWVLEARDQYRERAAEVALRLADAAGAAGDADAAVAWTRRALIEVRLRESVHRALMRRLAAAGERAEALAVYARLRALLAAEFGTPPSEESRALAAELRVVEPVGDQAASAPASRAVRRPESPLVGRETELAALTGAWEAARSGSGGVVLVAGPPGIGKSRIVRELAGHAVEQDARCSVGTAIELEGTPPFAPWADVLHEVVSSSPPPPREATWPSDLARLCPSVEFQWGGPTAPPLADPELERARLFEAVAEVLVWSCRDRPLLLVLEDVHLADAASLALLAYAGRRLPRSRGLLVVTTRVSHRRDFVLASDALARSGALVEEVELGPLGTEEIARLVDTWAPDLEPDARTRTIELSAGNPLLAREAAQAGGAGDSAHGLREFIRAPLARLPASARLLVDLVAAAARPLEHGEAAALVGAEQLPSALEAAEEAGLLETEHRRVRFVHSLVREACYGDVGAGRKLWLHGRLADVVLARSPRSVAEVARHLLDAGREGEAASYLEAAAAEARRLGALEEAAAFLGEAVTVASGNARLKAELGLLLADVEAWRGKRESHDTAFEGALAVLESLGDAQGLAHAYVARGRALRTTLCYPQEALAAYERALGILAAASIDAPELRALALAGAAWAEAAVGDPAHAGRLLASVEDLPDARADRGLAAELVLDRATALARAGRFRESEEVNLEAMRLALDANRPELARVALNFAVSAASSRGEFERALELTEKAPETGRAGTALELETLAARAYTLVRLERDDEACDVARSEELLARRSGDREQEAIAAFDAGSIALAARRYVDARARLAAALSEPAARTPRALARLRLAEARLGAGDLEGAAEEVARFPFEPVRPADMPAALVPRLERLQGLLAAAAGERPAALERLRAAEAAWRRLLADETSGDLFAANLVDLGRAPVAGLVEPAVELGQVLAEQALVLGGEGHALDARAAAEEAAALADELRFDRYRPTLERVHSLIEHV